MNTYTVYRMVAIEVEADSRKEAVNVSEIAHVYPMINVLFNDKWDWRWNGTSKIISAVKTK